MRTYITSVFADDQEGSPAFYTDIWEFVKTTEVPLGEHRWLTDLSPQDLLGVELLLGPDGHPAVAAHCKALTAEGIPCASFAVGDVPREVERLKALGVTFTQQTLPMGPVATTVLDDTFATLVQSASHQR